MRVEFNKAKWMQDVDGFWLLLKVQQPRKAQAFVAGMRDKLNTAEIKEYRKKRSLDANAYLWVLCQKIAEAVRNITKEDVYQEAVKNVGQFEFLPLRNDVVDTFIRRWSSRGLGWFAEKLDDCKIPNYTKVIVYYGSSTYDTREMSILLDYVINLAKDLDIETATPDEIALMKSRWDDAQADKGA